MIYTAKHKGDVARAYFYFYTMYQSQADNEAPNFFELQRETMCNWHFQDPVDEKEWNRNIKIAPYQDDKKNPFILDCRLARLYCSDIAEECKTVNTKDLSFSRLVSSPNPTMDKVYFDDADHLFHTYYIVNSSGQLVDSGNTIDIQSGIAIDVGHLVRGFYVIQLKDADGFVKATSRFIKL